MVINTAKLSVLNSKRCDRLQILYKHFARNEILNLKGGPTIGTAFDYAGWTASFSWRQIGISSHRFMIFTARMPLSVAIFTI